ncbi:hypothetical protein ABZX40_07490 [Streptomyces sp. NPDC004610]|uniref:hypothetical protein n=1 Tax=unclassified Streptomyces TaxID=2593676 RepID=UPI0033BB0949
MRSFDLDNADVPDPADRQAWLAQADALTAAGDPRGAAIRLEHLCESGEGGGDPAELASAYEQVEREFGLDGLRADGSWQFSWSRGLIDSASFRLVKETQPQRQALVEHLLAESVPQGTYDPADPEQWEGVLIDALLSHPAARLLNRLELHLTDYHHSAERAAVALSRRQWPRLHTLYFGHDFETLFEWHETSTGNHVQPERYLHAAVVPQTAESALWRSLPALRTLELEGAFLFEDVEHDALTHLRTRGAVLSDGSLFAYSTPALVSLEVEIEYDVHGVVASNAVLGDLQPSRYPRLRTLDLSEAHFDPDEAGDFVLLARHPILPQLTHLGIRDLVITEAETDGDAEDGEGDPLAVLAELAPRFAHLELEVAGDIEVEGAEDEDVDRILSGLGLGALADAGEVEG